MGRWIDWSTETNLATDGSTFIYLLIPYFFFFFLFFFLFFFFFFSFFIFRFCRGHNFSQSQPETGWEKTGPLTEASSTGYRPLTHAAPALSMARRSRLCCLVYSDLVMSASDTGLHTRLPFWQPISSAPSNLCITWSNWRLPVMHNYLLVSLSGWSVCFSRQRSSSIRWEDTSASHGSWSINNDTLVLQTLLAQRIDTNKDTKTALKCWCYALLRSVGTTFGHDRFLV